MSTNTITAGAFTVALGIHKGRNHIYVTHNRVGRQWVSKDPVDENTNIERTAEFIAHGYTKFHLDSTDRSGKFQQSCDTRFWLEVLKPVTPNPLNGEFDQLCFD